MRNRLLKSWAVLAVSLISAGPRLVGAGVPAEAKDRAALYQAEASKLFSEYHWRIVQNRVGKFTAMHAAGTGGATFNNVGYAPGPSGMGPIMAHLTVTFQPESAIMTRCFVRVVGYTSFFKDKAGKPMVYGPFDGNTPENARYIRGKLADAEKRMVRKHPEYGAQ